MEGRVQERQGFPDLTSQVASPQASQLCAMQESLQPSEHTGFHAAVLNAVQTSKNCLWFLILKEVY